MGKKSRRQKAGKKGNAGGSGGGGSAGAGGKRAPAAVSTYVPDTSGFGPAPSPEAVDAFWAWFAENEHNLRDAFCSMHQFNKELGKVSPNLCLWYDIENPSLRSPEEPHRLILSAGGTGEKAFNTVLSLIRAAPTDLRWRFTAFRRRKEIDGGSSVFCEGKSYPHSNVRYVLLKEDNIGKIGIWLYLRGFHGDLKRLPEAEREYFTQVGWTALDDALGEYDVEMHVGEVKFHSSLDAPLHCMEYGSEVYPLSQLARDFDGWLSEKIGPKPKGGWAELAGLGCKLDVGGGAAGAGVSPTSVAAPSRWQNEVW